MRKLICLLLCLCMILPGVALGEEDLLEEEEFLDDEEIVVTDDMLDLFDDLENEIDDTVDLANLQINPNLPDDTINILLVGVDTRYKELGAGVERGDVQIIASIDPAAGTIKLSSIMRDLYVPIYGRKNSRRINTAYTDGGQVAIQTINSNFEMNIEHYIAINFYGVVSIVESLGGIDVELTKAEARAINKYLKEHKSQISRTYDDKKGDRQKLEEKAGVQHLDGLQALMYARLRHSDKNDNDFNRTSRQRKLLELLLTKVLTNDDTDYIGLLTNCMQYVKTNMNPMDILSMMMTILGSDLIDRAKSGETLLEDFRIPMDETWKYDTKDGSSVVTFRTNDRKQQNVEGLHTFIYGQYYPAN